MGVRKARKGRRTEGDRKAETVMSLTFFTLICSLSLVLRNVKCKTEVVVEGIGGVSCEFDHARNIAQCTKRHILDKLCRAKSEGLVFLVIPSGDRHNLSATHRSRPLQCDMAQPTIFFPVDREGSISLDIREIMDSETEVLFDMSKLLVI